MTPDDPSDILDDAKDAWQAAGPSGEASVPDERLLQRVKEEAEAFDERLRRRDRREMIAGAIVFLVFATMLGDPSWMVRIGALIVMGSSVLIGGVLRRARTADHGAVSDRPLAEAVRAEREKVDTQIWLLENVLWWYLAPMMGGLG
ncbi:MAG: hypothetical protein V5A58_13965, partial [Salinibacter sp.]|uniref:hypothetical protein n=1 Tax=Salinibacter sp. TaxID=2065818 RepID=UPI002FC33C5F